MKNNNPRPTNIFQKWYKADARGDCWFVVRADLPNDKGTRIGPVGAKGARNNYLKAKAMADNRNQQILAKRAEMHVKLKRQGWTAEQIYDLINQSQAAVQAVMGAEYKEELP